MNGSLKAGEASGGMAAQAMVLRGHSSVPLPIYKPGSTPEPKSEGNSI